MNLFIRAINFVKQASSARTLTILGILTLLAAVPLTVYVAQQQQDIRQRASISCTTCDSNHTSCSANALTAKNSALDAAEATHYSCRQNCTSDAECNGCITTLSFKIEEIETAYQSALTSCNNTLSACQYTCTPVETPPTPTPTPAGCRCINGTWGPDPGACTPSLYGQSCVFQCSGTELVDNVMTEYDCQLSEDSGTYGCQNGWFASSRIPNVCSNQGTYCCQRNASTAAPTSPPGGAPGGQCPSMSCKYSEIQNGSTVCFTGTGTNGFNDGCRYVAGCSEQVACPSSPGGTQPTTPPAGGQPPPGGTAPTAVPTAVPTALPGQPENCDPSKVNMSVFPTNPAVGASVTFSLSGTQGATHVGDTWSGGVNCSGGFAGNKSCNATAEGTFTWTHTWRNCLGSLSNCSNTTCTKQQSFTIGVATPTAPPVVTQPPAGPGDTQLAFTLTLSSIQSGRSLIAPSRDLQVELFNDSGNLVTTKTVSNILQYVSSSGKFTATVNMGGITQGSYIVKVKTDRHLKKRAPGIITVPSTGSTITVQETALIAGDINGDNKIDIQDYNQLIGCFGNKANTASCTNKTLADLDDNGSIEEVDYNVFVRSLAIQTGD